MNLKVTLSVKFRAFGITFGKVGPVEYSFPVPVAAAILAEALVKDLHLDQRGVKLDAVMEGAV